MPATPVSSFTLATATNGTIDVDGVTLAPGTPKSVPYLTVDMINAYKDNLIHITPGPVSIDSPVSTLTDSTGGTNTSTTLVSVASYADSNNNFAIIALQINGLIDQFEQLKANVQNLSGSGMSL